MDPSQFREEAPLGHVPLLPKLSVFGFEQSPPVWCFDVKSPRGGIDYMPGRPMGDMVSQKRKEIVADFFRLIGEGRPRDGLKYFAADCVQHNPYVQGGVGDLLDSMAAVQKEQASEFAEPNIFLKHMLEEGDVVAAHTQILFSRSNPGEGGLRQVHIFRFGGDDKVVEYWDVTQMIQRDMPQAANAF